VHDPDIDLRARAAMALSKMGHGTKEVVPALAQALKDPEPLVRMNAAHALLRLGPDARPAAPALIEALRDDRNRVKADMFQDTIQEIVAVALGKATAGTDEGVQPLIEA